MINVFLDDVRTIQMVYPDVSPDEEETDWQIIKTADEFERYILACYGKAWIGEVPSFPKFPDLISFDHDLGELDGVIERTGMDCAKFLVEADMDGLIDIPHDFNFAIHSSNPAGAENIRSYLSNYINVKFGI